MWWGLLLLKWPVWSSMGTMMWATGELCFLSPLRFTCWETLSLSYLAGRLNKTGTELLLLLLLLPPWPGEEGGTSKNYKYNQNILKCTTVVRNTLSRNRRLIAKCPLPQLVHCWLSPGLSGPTLSVFAPQSNTDLWTFFMSEAATLSTSSQPWTNIIE